MTEFLHRLLCKLGMHSTYVQTDRWGQGVVCRYCLHDFSQDGKRGKGTGQ